MNTGQICLGNVGVVGSSGPGDGSDAAQLMVVWASSRLVAGNRPVAPLFPPGSPWMQTWENANLHSPANQSKGNSSVAHGRLREMLLGEGRTSSLGWSAAVR